MFFFFTLPSVPSLASFSPAAAPPPPSLGPCIKEKTNQTRMTAPMVQVRAEMVHNLTHSMMHPSPPGKARGQWSALWHYAASHVSPARHDAAAATLSWEMACSAYYGHDGLAWFKVDERPVASLRIVFVHDRMIHTGVHCAFVLLCLCRRHCPACLHTGQSESDSHPTQS